MPVDISKRVAQYVQLRDLIKVKEKNLKRVLAPYKKALEDLNTVLLNHLNDIGGNSLNTDAGTVYRTEKKSASSRRSRSLHGLRDHQCRFRSA